MKTIAGVRFEGPRGWAQHVRVPGHPNTEVNIATWLMRLPEQTIGADYFLLFAGSLRQRDGVPDSVLKYPEAEYELQVASLVPDRNPRVEESDSWAPMEPVNVSIQFHGITPQQVARMVSRLAEACVHGHLPAETQMVVHPFNGDPKIMFIKVLVELWENTVAEMVEHERTGGLHRRVN